MSRLLKGFENGSTFESSLNLAHFHSRRAEQHLKYGRYDDAIQNHKETVRLLSKAIDESTIPKNVEYLEEQRTYHENIQHIIQRKKSEFDQYVQRNQQRLKKESKSGKKKNALKKTKAMEDVAATSSDSPIVIVSDLTTDCDNNDFFSLVSELKDVNEPAISILAVTAVHVDDDSCSDNDEFVSMS